VAELTKKTGQTALEAHRSMTKKGRQFFWWKKMATPWVCGTEWHQP